MDLDKDLTYRFFMCFARMEYALKRSGFRRRHQQGRGFDIAWDQFADSIRSRWAELLEDDRFRAARDFLIAAPPMKQVVLEGGALDWEEIKPYGPEAGFLLDCVRRVRNNLFHGGKFPSGPIASPERNTLLLEQGSPSLTAHARSTTTSGTTSKTKLSLTVGFLDHACAPAESRGSRAHGFDRQAGTVSACA
jgi:hypothetical protein